MCIEGMSIEQLLELNQTIYQRIEQLQEIRVHSTTFCQPGKFRSTVTSGCPQRCCLCVT